MAAAFPSVSMNLSGLTKGTMPSAQTTAPASSSTKTTQAIPGGVTVSGLQANSNQSNLTSSNAPTTANTNAAGQITSQVASQPKSNYTIVTSKPARDNLADITAGYNNIKQGMANQTTANADKAKVPQIQGYNVTTTPMSGPGTLKFDVNGQTYYAQNLNPGTGASSDDIIKALSSNYGATNESVTPASTTTPQAPTTPATGTSTPTTTNAPTNGLSSENASYQAQAGQINNDLTNAYNSFQSTVQQIQTGAFPLTGAQQALVDSTTQAFNGIMNAAQLRGRSLNTQYAGLSEKLNGASGQLMNIEAAKTAALAKLEQGFQDQNYKLISDSYKAFTDMETAKTNILDKMHSDVVTQFNADRTYQNDLTKIAQAQQAENEKEAMDAFDRVYKTEQLQLQGAGLIDANGNSTNPTPVTTTSSGAPDPTSQAQFLSKYPTGTQALIKGIADYSLDPTKLASLKGNSREALLSIVKQYDPSYDASQYAARAAYNKSLQSGPLSQAIVAANKSIAHLIQFSTDVSSLGNQPISSGLNALGKTIESPFNPGLQQGVSQAQTEAAGLKDELAKFFKGSGTTDVGSIETWGNSLDVNATPGQLKGTVQGAVNLLAGQLDVLNQQYTSTMGKPADFSKILQPDTIAKLSTLKNEGYQVNIPGVPYTDPVAYVKADPANAETLNTIHQNFPELTPAQALQLAQAQ